MRSTPLTSPSIRLGRGPCRRCIQEAASSMRGVLSGTAGSSGRRVGLSGGRVLLRVCVERKSTPRAAQPVGAPPVVPHPALACSLDLGNKSVGNYSTSGGGVVASRQWVNSCVDSVALSAVFVHARATYSPVCEPRFAWRPKDRSLRLLPTTKALERAIAAPASIGSTSPRPARGIATTL